MRQLLKLSFAMGITLSACAPAGKGTQPSGKTYSGQSSQDASVETDEAKDPIIPVTGSILSAKPFSTLRSKLIQDGFTFTFAAVSFAEKADYRFRGRFLYDENLSEIPNRLRDQLANLCESLGAHSEGEDLVLSWRTHYSQTKVKALSELIARGHRSLACVLELENSSRESAYLAFDPVPSLAKTYIGVDVTASRNLSGLMLLSERMLDLRGERLLRLDSENRGYDSLPALASRSQVPIYTPEKGNLCVLANGSNSNLLNPNEAKNFTASFQGAKIRAIEAIPINGKILPSCEKVQLVPSEQSLEIGLTCGSYLQTKLEGLEAGCQWRVTVENLSDPEDEGTGIVSLPKVALRSAGAKTWALGKDTVAQSSRNPIRLKSIQLNGFTDIQLSFLEKAFDVILELAPEIYQSDFENYMRSATLGTSGSCSQPGVMGFASVGGNSITLCQYMFGGGIDSPASVVGAAHTILHEVRHARGYYHDIDRPAYEPCRGTAYANLFDHNIVVTCDKAYCSLLKSAAEGSYLNDINYSLRSDERRFQGLCKEWQNNLGFSDERIKLGR